MIYMVKERIANKLDCFRPSFFLQIAARHQYAANVIQQCAGGPDPRRAGRYPLLKVGIVAKDYHQVAVLQVAFAQSLVVWVAGAIPKREASLPVQLVNGHLHAQGGGAGTVPIDQVIDEPGLARKGRSNQTNFKFGCLHVWFWFLLFFTHFECTF